MEILVNKVTSSAEDIVIHFTSEFGSCEAYWNSKKKPEANRKYHVELDITDELVWGQDVKPSKDKKFSISMEDDEIYICGIIDKIYKDGQVDLRFGKSLIQLEVDGKRMPAGEYVTVKTTSLEVYDTNF